MFGEEVNDETYAICRSDMMVKGQDASHIFDGNSFSEDGFPGQTFDYLLANPPFGVEWKKVENEIRTEHEKLGFHGRFGAGLPRINDGSFLFLQHMISKMKPASEGGSRVAIMFNGSPLFTGAAGSGETEIRRWIIEKDWLEAVAALPDQLFYNPGINTYFWVVTNRKSPERRGKVQLVDARECWVKMRKSLGTSPRRSASNRLTTSPVSTPTLQIGLVTCQICPLAPLILLALVAWWWGAQARPPASGGKRHTRASRRSPTPYDCSHVGAVPVGRLNFPLSMRDSNQQWTGLGCPALYVRGGARPPRVSPCSDCSPLTNWADVGVVPLAPSPPALAASPNSRPEIHNPS